MEKQLRLFLGRYLGQGKEKKDKVLQEDIDMLVHSAVYDHIEQEIIDYGTAHPEAPFWDFLHFIKPGLKGVTPEELLSDGEED